MADPSWADPSSLELRERRLRRARALIDPLADEAPQDLDTTRAQVHVHAKLGTVVQRRGRADEAAACFRPAIELAGTIIECPTPAPRMRG